MTENDTLRSIGDTQAITAQLYRYCRAIDRMDHALGYSLWHADGFADYPGVYTGSGKGFIDFVCTAHQQTIAHSHQVTNIIINLDGDIAGSEAYFTSNLRIAAGDRLQQITVWGRYLDRWSRRAGRWAIDKRIGIRDFDERREIITTGQSPGGRRDFTDPSYAVLMGIASGGPGSALDKLGVAPPDPH